MSVRKVALVGLASLALLAHPRGQTPVPDALTYSRGFLITGNYVVGGVDLPKAGGPGIINVGPAFNNAVPDAADIVAAYLYWETITSSSNPLSGATFRGTPIGTAKATTITTLPGTPAASCWGAAGGSAAKLTMFRADVLGHLPKQLDAAGAWTGKYIVNNADLEASSLPLHTVTLPQEGTGNVLTQSAGASLVLVYRDPAEPLRKIVIYDGAHAQAQGTPTAQTISGFYKSATDPSARLTHIVGSGASNTGERLLVNGSVVATDPVAGPIDGGADRGWAQPTVGVSSALPGTDTGDGYGERITTRVDHGSAEQSATPYECLAWAAMVLSTAVADVDRDGLPDGLEDAPAGLKDPATPAFPDGQPLPNLNQMGASSEARDLFVEINAMWAPPGTSYGSEDAPYNSTTSHVTDAAGHSHLPTPEVLKMVGDAYALNGIRPHFDVGNVEAYRALPGHACEAGDPVCDASLYLVPTAHARGGEMIRERACDPSGAVTCQFPDYPGTVGWKFGVQLHKDAPVGDSGEELTSQQTQQWGTGMHRRRFDRARTDFVRYLLYAHARGKSKSPLPCLDANGQPSGYDITTPTKACTTRNPLFHVPSSTSGIADLPGNTAMVTLGLWENFRGSTFVQASTTLHELGHTLNLWHGGAPATWGSRTTPTYVEPNCKPNYLSSMSYLFQAHGLVDASGDVRIDYSRATYPAINEAVQSDGPLGPALRYVPVWFAPATSPLASILGVSQSTRFCTGVRFDPAAPPRPMARVHAGTPDGTVDWDGDSTTTAAGSQDVNFDGTTGETLAGHDDWANLRLDQIGAGRRVRIVSSASGDFLDFGSGDFLDFGSGDFLDFGSGDFLDFGAGTYYVNFNTGDFLDFGSGDFLDFGSGDFLDFGSGVLLPDAAGVMGASGDFLDFGSGDFLDFGSGDFLDFGSGDFLDFGSGDFLDFGSGDFLDFGSGDFLDFGAGAGGQELDFDLARAMGRTPPRKLEACVLGATCAGTQPLVGDSQYHRTSLRWKAPTFGHVFTYRVYRVTGTITAASPRVLVGTTSSTSLVDAEELPNGVSFTYFVTAEFDDEMPHAVSGASNFVVITAVNDAPVAAGDSYATIQGTPVSVPAADGVLTNDTDADSAPTSLRVALPVAGGPAHGTLIIQPDGSFTYTPNAGFFGIDSFSYRANDGAWPRDASVALSDDSDLAIVTISVSQVVAPPPTNQAPVCPVLNATATTGGSVTLSHNCTDANGDPVTVTSVGTATLGTTSLLAGGSFSYAVASPKVGADSFTYTVTDGKASVTATVAMRAIYGFTNVENLPPRNGKVFNPGSTIPLKWRWTNASGVALDSSAAQPVVTGYSCTTGGKLPPAYLLGPFTPAQPGSGNSFVIATKKNSFTWQFNWKLTYTVTDATGTKILNLPAGTYVVAIGSAVTGQTDPGSSHSCDGGRTLTGALIVVQ